VSLNLQIEQWEAFNEKTSKPTGLCPSMVYPDSSLHLLMEGRRMAQEEQYEQKMNLHELIEKDSVSKSKLDMIQRLKFISYFLFSILRERHKYEKFYSKYYRFTEMVFVSELDIHCILEDIYNYLLTSRGFIHKPLMFIEKYLSFIFSESESYSSQSFYKETIKHMIKDYLHGSEDKSMAIRVKNAKYELFRKGKKKFIINTFYIRTFFNDFI
jgi:hypothetical protein